MPLDTTVGGPRSNSYLTVEEADEYHATRLHNSGWASADAADKEKALIWATRMLDNGVRFVGRRYGLYQEQALQWPRNSATDREGFYIEYNVIPRQVKEATAELAWLLLARDRTAAESGDSTQAIRSVAVGPIRLGFSEDREKVRETREEPIPATGVDLLQGLGTLVGKTPLRVVRT